MQTEQQPITNAFSVDLEDWYHGVELPVETWPKYEKRVEKGFYTLLELLEEKNVKATWFTMGWIGKHYPDLIRILVKSGHEIGTHNYHHDIVYQIGPERFREEIRRAKHVLEDVSGTPVVAHRSPYFSVTAKSLWALDILAEEGFTIDSSISPVETWRYGLASCPDEIFRIQGTGLIEFPATAFKFMRRSWSVGGAYFRLLPYSVTGRAIRQRLRDGRYTMFYIHPWEYDPFHPKVKFDSRQTQITHYTRLKSTVPNTRKLLQHYSFDTVSNVIRNYEQQYGIRTLSTDILLCKA
jgi:polysaccharide deacetylase family protein (PEP-CTERM system associated)